jgi:hypothetical protein
MRHRPHQIAYPVVALLACCHGGDAPEPRMLDGRRLDAFENLAPWHATGSDGVSSAIHAVPGVHGQALRLALDLDGTAGYAVARRALALALPSDFELSFELRGEVPINNFELKLVDETGDNVWWFRRPDFAFPASWRHMIVTRRQIEFAWGPIADHSLRRIAAIELVVSAGHGGGKGWIEIDELAIVPRPEITTPPAGPRAIASSSAPGGAPGSAIDGDGATAWASDPAAGAAQTFTLDLGRERELGGLFVQWAGSGFATDYTVAVSRDGAAWQTAAAITRGDGGIDPIFLSEATARFVRLQLARGAANGYRLADLAVIDAAAGGSANAFMATLARRTPRGSFPRGFSGEQPYWTVAGVDGAGHNSLMSEDGAIELAGGASIEPFVETADHLTSWATAGEIVPSLEDGYLPIPSVTWRDPAWELRVTALAIGDATSAELAGRYTLRNRTAAPLTARLVLAVRPFQITPPTQTLGKAGGVRRIERIAWTDGTLVIDGVPALRPLAPPVRVGLWPLHAVGYPIAPVVAPSTPAPVVSPTTPSPVVAPTTPSPVVDPAGLASGALVYEVALAPGGEASVVVVAPLVGRASAPALPAPAAAPAWFDAALASAKRAWHDKLDRVGFRVPASDQPIVETLRSSLAYMLLSRDGPILRPGTRSYARAWIRDGAMIGEALLRLGHPEVAAAFLRWYAPYQFASGKVPCCVEPRGAVPVPENDSHGELIHLAAEVYRYTRDRDQLAAVWPHVRAAARYLEQLRQSERTPANQTADRRALYGLLPPSISHEGYSAKPAYSYWDDFWGLTGYNDAAWLARELGDGDAAARLAAQGDELRHDIVASITQSAAAHRVAYIPGAADLGDFDATSTTIALSPGGEQDALPQELLRATFERAWQALALRQPEAPAALPEPRRPAEAPPRGETVYTPYELRLVGTFVRLGWRARAGAALARYMADQRPRAWNQWAEVVGASPREPRFIGDMPHAWVHSDYARSALDLFAYERARDRACVLAAGIPPAWFTGAGFGIDRLPTSFGPLSYAVTATDRSVTLELGPGAVPPGGLVFPWPLATPPGQARINGKPARWRNALPELLITKRPATIVISRSGDAKQP